MSFRICRYLFIFYKPQAKFQSQSKSNPKGKENLT